MNDNNEAKESKKANDDYNNDFCNFFRKLEKSDEERKEDLKNFIKIKTNVNDSIFDISNNFFKINDFDEFLDLNEDIDDKSKKEIDKSYSNCSIAFIILFFGILYSAIQLIGVQEMIIILNSMLNELIDELKLAITKSPREYNFYEVIKVCSYKEIPDIDVAMVTSFLGIIISKSLGFILTNILVYLRF